MNLPFRPFFRLDTYRALLFLAAAPAIGAAVLGILIAGWTAVGVLAVTPLVVPVLISFRGAIGLLAHADAALARSLLGVEAQPPILSGGRGFWGRGKAVVTDAAFWKQQAYLVVRMTVGFALAVGEFSLVAAAGGSLFFPAWYRWSDLHFGSWQVDTFARSLVLVPAGLIGLVVAAYAARLFGAFSGWLVRSLLRQEPREPLAPEQVRRARRRALRIEVGLAVGLLLTQVAIWAGTGAGYFWPEWVVLPLALLLAVQGWIELVEERPGLQRVSKGFAIHAGVAAALVAFLILVWAVTSQGYFWPAWVALWLAIPLGIHALVVRAMGRQRLARRVESLETTRSEAVDAQDAELRRIERDIHDGAQARLVALGMSLGMAEQKFSTDPEAAQRLVAEARAGVAEALHELRDLARGIYPPVLSDRGLEAALASLADRSVLPAKLTVDLEGRLSPQVEAAAYFVAAEALANAGKHSRASGVEITARRRGDRLEVTVTDDGRGGADPGGSGLTGLRRRVAALDGTLTVTSPSAGPTTIRAELPCAS